jgi:hypothetical protein
VKDGGLVEVVAVELFRAGMFTYSAGQVLEVDRARACRWWLEGLITTEAAFTQEESRAAARDVLADLEAQRCNRGQDERNFVADGRVAATLRRIARVLGVDGPDGPGKVAA